ncbi:MAG: M1 family metallopeptidase, partial [Bacteroidia bacterium]|nr:M1 family metallopeptidase [Bacteroidia bacterium]
WVPCMDAPAVRFTYSANIHCPSDLMALMSAENSPVKSRDGNYTFNMPQAIPSYLLALTIGDFEFRSLGKNCGVFAEPAMIEKAYNEFSDLPNMLKVASEMYGPYGWGRYDVVVMPPSFPFGGMENPRVTFATPTIIVGDKSLVSLIAHELAHSWSGNLVTNNTWNDFWLNEGFTVYFEGRIMEKLYGKDYADMLAEISFGELQTTLEDLKDKPEDTKLYLNLKDRDPDEGVSDIAYVKGCFFLKSIEDNVGRKKWDAFLNAYFKNFAWKTVTTQQFIDFLEANLIAKNPGLKINYNEWIYGRGLPANCPVVKSAEFEKVEQSIAKLMQTQEVEKLDVKGWTTHHWLHFMRNLPVDSINPIMGRLDTAFNLTGSANAEIQCDWYGLCIDNNYTLAYPAIEEFLCNVGRRKFVKPLFEKLVKTPEGKEFAKKIFARAEKTYHAVTADTVRDILEN